MFLFYFLFLSSCLELVMSYKIGQSFGTFLSHFPKNHNLIKKKLAKGKSPRKVVFSDNSLPPMKMLVFTHKN